MTEITYSVIWTQNNGTSREEEVNSLDDALSLYKGFIDNPNTNPRIYKITREQLLP